MRRARSLNRVIFAWLAATVFVTTLAMGLLGYALATFGHAAPYTQELERMEQFGEHLFAGVWHDPQARTELARLIADDLDVRVKLRAPDGTELAAAGEQTCRGRTRSWDVVRDGTKLGEVETCLTKRPRPAARFFFSVLLILAVLWLASALVARRIGKPVVMLTKTAERFGAGDLEARADLSSGPAELVVLATTFNQMADHTERQLDEQRTLLAEVSHELRTPLGHVRVLLELLKDAGSDAEHSAALETEIEAMDHLVGQLLARSRLDFELDRMLPLDVVESAVRAAERCGLDPALLRADGELRPVAADAALLAIALSNLLRNGETHGGGVTAFVVESQDEGVAFLVEDAGPGFDSETAFAAFVQGEGSESGLGLGLALVARIADAHGGRVISTQLASGSRVGIWLPSASSGPEAG